MSTLHINRPRHVGLLHETTMTVYLNEWPDMTPTVCDPLAKSPRELWWCHKCRKRKWAKNLTVIRGAYYDPMIYCADGCRAFKNKRNAAARKRYAKRKAAAA